MLCGVSTRWKMVVAYHFTGSSFCGKTIASLVKEIIGRALGIGITVVGTPNDMGGCNEGF